MTHHVVHGSLVVRCFVGGCCFRRLRCVRLSTSKMGSYVDERKTGTAKVAYYCTDDTTPLLGADDATKSLCDGRRHTGGGGGRRPRVQARRPRRPGLLRRALGAAARRGHGGGDDGREGGPRERLPHPSAIVPPPGACNRGVHRLHRQHLRGHGRSPRAWVHGDLHHRDALAAGVHILVLRGDQEGQGGGGGGRRQVRARSLVDR